MIQTKYLAAYEWSNRTTDLPGIYRMAVADLRYPRAIGEVPNLVDHLAAMPAGHRAFIPVGLFSNQFENHTPELIEKYLARGIDITEPLMFARPFGEALRRRGITLDWIIGDTEVNMSAWMGESFMGSLAAYIRAALPHQRFRRQLTAADLARLEAGDVPDFPAAIFAGSEYRDYTMRISYALIRAYDVDAWRRLWMSSRVLVDSAGNLRTRITNWDAHPRYIHQYDPNWWKIDGGNLIDGGTSNPVAYVGYTGAHVNGVPVPLSKHPTWNNMIKTVNLITAHIWHRAVPVVWISHDEYGDRRNESPTPPCNAPYYESNRIINHTLWRHLIRRGVRRFVFWNARVPVNSDCTAVFYGDPTYTQPGAERLSELLLEEDRYWPRAFLPQIPLDADEIVSPGGLVTRYSDFVAYLGS